jgi:hypothetical protein
MTESLDKKTFYKFPKALTIYVNHSSLKKYYFFCFFLKPIAFLFRKSIRTLNKNN